MNETQTFQKKNEDFGEGFTFLDKLPRSRKLMLLPILCLAFFLDTFNNSSLLPALPAISGRVGLSFSQSAWLLAGYQLTFAALLLISGRVTDLYNPKWVFTLGSLIVAVFSLVSGFIRSGIPLIVFRAIMGIGGALTIPSAQHIIVHLYRDPKEQARAIALFGAMGALGNVLGLIIGALFVSFVSWPWVFYFSAIVAFAVCIGTALLIPDRRPVLTHEPAASKFKRLDIVGAIIFAACLILFIFSLTSSSLEGWTSAQTLAPLVISLLAVLAFFAWEAHLPESYAALPPKIWRYGNVKILTAVSLVPFMWLGSIFPLYSWLWETVYHWSAIKCGIHFLPIALASPVGLMIATYLQAKFPLKNVNILGFVLLVTGTILLPFGNSEHLYWRFSFPGFLLATCGVAMVYATANIGLLASTPPEVSGIVSAMFMAMLQTGGAAGIAIISSIQTGVEANRGGPTVFDGRAAGLWFLVCFSGLMMILSVIFMTGSKSTAASSEAGRHLTDRDSIDSALTRTEAVDSGAVKKVETQTSSV
ncbi:major facilitator superfamily domain-containing protein [Panaeolus papilionaceus]|nr:major facilitator superfamily domain-containing protein [Panaeolus papilionaceus]